MQNIDGNALLQANGTTLVGADTLPHRAALLLARTWQQQQILSSQS